MDPEVKKSDQDVQDKDPEVAESLGEKKDQSDGSLKILTGESEKPPQESKVENIPPPKQEKQESKEEVQVKKDLESEEHKADKKEAKEQRKEEKPEGKQTSEQKQQQKVQDNAQQEQEKVLRQRPISVQFGKDSLQMQGNEVVLEESPITITVPSSEDRGFALNKHTYFKIVGTDNHGSFDIERRFSQFESLRKILLERWPGCFIPNLSQRSDIKSQELKQAHKRKNLELFLKKISMSQFIYYKEEVQLFLRSYGMDMNEMFETMPVLRVKDVIDRFKYNFDNEVQKHSTSENATYITRCSTALKKILNNLGDLSKRSLKLAESYDYYRNTMPKFAQIITAYEKSNLSEYSSGDVDKLVSMRDSDNKLEKFDTMKGQNIFYEFYFMFETESRDAEALIDIILAMEMFNIKKDDLSVASKETRLEIDQISLGYKNMKMMTSRKPKEQVIAELQQKEKELIAERHSITELYNISEIVLATKTIPSFKKMKRTNYFRLIKLWAEQTGSTTEQLFSLWKFLEEEAKGQLKNCKKN